jgi:hypothetical protein
LKTRTKEKGKKLKGKKLKGKGSKRKEKKAHYPSKYDL